MAVTITQLIQTVFKQKRHFILLLLGFSSGLPAALTASTLQAWFTESGIDLHTIGAVTLLVIPYSFRFLWAPIFDYLKVPWIDRRRGWMLLTQLGLMITISSMAFYTPQELFKFSFYAIPWLMVLGFITAMLSTSQDIVINAYQIEILPVEERGLGAAVYVTGWRIGAIISGALALVLAKEIGWRETYLLMAGLISIGMIAAMIAPQPTISQRVPHNLFYAVIEPIIDFFKRYRIKTATFFLLIIITYKLSDALTLALNTTFLLRYVGFDLLTGGLVNKTISLILPLLGGILAGVLMTRLSLYRALMVFGLIQGTANLSYAALAYWGKSLWLLIFAAFAENFCSGMGNIALLALIMALCNIQFTATQFALLSAMAFLARTFVGPVAAIMVDAMGWLPFFIICFLISLPTLLFTFANKAVIQELNRVAEK